MCGSPPLRSRLHNYKPRVEVKGEVSSGVIRSMWCGGAVFDKSRARVSGPPHCADDGTQATTHILPPAHDIKPFRSTFFKRSPCNGCEPFTDAALMPAAEPSPVSWACLSSAPFQARESVALTWRPHDVPPRRPPAGLARRTLARSTRRARFARPNLQPCVLSAACPPASVTKPHGVTNLRVHVVPSGRGLVSFVTRRGARAGEHACRANVGPPPPPKPKPPAQRRSGRTRRGPNWDDFTACPRTPRGGASSP